MATTSPQRPRGRRRGYLLRTCAADMTSHGGFVWPRRGYVAAPDWDPAPRCGGGLHGLLAGEGDGDLLDWAASARWLVVLVDLAEVVDLGDKAKVPHGWVVQCGGRADAAELIAHLYPGATVVGAVVTGGNGAVVTGGNRATVTGGNRAVVTGGDRAVVTGGNGAVVTGGNGAVVTGGDRAVVTGGAEATVTGGYEATVTGGYEAVVTGGDRAVVTGGVGAVVTGGDGACLLAAWWDCARKRVHVGYVGEGGIEPGAPYRVNVTDGGAEFVRCDR